MWDDAKPSSHPIVVKNVTDAAEIISLFDSITYSKGSSILRMLEKTVGAGRFQKALQEYLIINAASVGDPVSFYNELFATTSGEEFMKNWLEEQNYPLLHVNLTVVNNETTVLFTQSRFIISDVLNVSLLNKDYRWKINVRCVLGKNTHRRLRRSVRLSSGGDVPFNDTVNMGGDTIELMLEAEQETRVLMNKSYSWIKCNRDSEGFYVTDYTFETNAWLHFSSVLEEKPTVRRSCCRSKDGDQ